MIDDALILKAIHCGRIVYHVVYVLARHSAAMHRVLLFLVVADLFPVVLRVTTAAVLRRHSAFVKLDDLLIQLLELPLCYLRTDHAMATDFDPDVENIGHHWVNYVELINKLFRRRCLQNFI